MVLYYSLLYSEASTTASRSTWTHGHMYSMNMCWPVPRESQDARPASAVIFSFGSVAPTPYKCHTTPAGAHMQPHKCASCETLSPALVQWTMLLCTRYLALYPSIPRSIRGAKSSTCANADCCVPQWPDPRVPPAKVAKHERPLAGASSMLGGCWCRLCPLAHPASCADRDAFVALGAGDELLRLRQERLGAWDRIRDVLVMLE